MFLHNPVPLKSLCMKGRDFELTSNLPDLAGRLILVVFFFFFFLGKGAGETETRRSKFGSRARVDKNPRAHISYAPHFNTFALYANSFTSFGAIHLRLRAFCTGQDARGSHVESRFNCLFMRRNEAEAVCAVFKSLFAGSDHADGFLDRCAKGGERNPIHSRSGD